MKIAQIAPLQLSVPPHAYGGTERVIYNLTEALVRLGHNVTLFATADSTTSAKLVPMLEKPLYFSPEHDANAFHIAMLDAVYTQYADVFDVIHSHLDYLTLPFLRHTRTPTVLTLHGRLDKPEWSRVFHEYADANYVSISDDQRGHLAGINYVATVHNGIAMRDIPFYATADNYLAFIGRMSPDKRPDLAIEVAKRCGIPIKIAAKVDHSEAIYFKKEIQPLLDDPLVEWLGEINEREKRALIGNALALILPIAWPEPFGLVFIEALACGTPVVSCPIGSVPELLEDGLTGYSGRTVDELVAAVRQTRHLSRRACRAYAMQRFSDERMALDYLRVYERVRRVPVSHSRRSRQGQPRREQIHGLPVLSAESESEGDGTIGASMLP
jgi:glycosyltransferase involved in cell wall biosynthesis